MIDVHNVTSIRAEYLDCCYPDYFQGSMAEEVLAVPVHKGMTYREAYEAAKEEFRRTEGFFTTEDAGAMGENALHALFASMLAEDTDKPANFTQYVEEDSEAYLYIGLFAESDT